MVDKKKDYFDPGVWEAVFARSEVVDYPLVFVHGIARREDIWEDTVKLITNDDYYRMRYREEDEIFHNYDGRIPSRWGWTVSYYISNPVVESLTGNLTLYAQRLERMINIIKSITNKDKVILVAHSMGGLVSRKYMTMNKENWNSVHKILTVGTPNLGVDVSVGIVGQLRDVKEGSEFVTELNNRWEEMTKKEDKQKWGVVGAVDLESAFNDLSLALDATDSCGPGFVKISSAIPYETEEAVDNFGQPVFNTPHFGFRLAVNANHIELLLDEGTFRGVEWAVKRY